MSRFDILRIGDEQHALAIIDNFASDPAALRAVAVASTFDAARHSYPGVRAALPDDYLPQQADVVREAATSIGLRDDGMTVIDASFSLVTTQRAALSLSQRLPHCDSYDPGRVAFVHYLDPSEESGGTAFFRHRSTRFESIDRNRSPIYEGQLDAELRYGRPPAPDYIGDNDHLFERIAMVPARYNRAVLYRSFSLHSGVIPVGSPLSPDPATGRLTVTGFLSFP